MKHRSLCHLEIIGYASQIETPTLPRILPPVFRVRAEKDIILLPPFAVLCDEVFNFTTSNPEELNALVAQQNLTLLDTPFDGAPNFDLWVNEQGVISYSATREITQAFEQIFTASLREAEQALRAKNYVLACEKAAVARAVKPGHQSPLVIRAAAEKLMGNTQRYTFTRHIAEKYMKPEDFDQLVENRLGEDSYKEVRGSMVMAGIAAILPNDYAAR